VIDAVHFTRGFLSSSQAIVATLDSLVPLSLFFLFLSVFPFFGKGAKEERLN